MKYDSSHKLNRCYRNTHLAEGKEEKTDREKNITKRHESERDSKSKIEKQIDTRISNLVARGDANKLVEHCA